MEVDDEVEGIGEAPSGGEAAPGVGVEGPGEGAPRLPATGGGEAAPGVGVEGPGEGATGGGDVASGDGVEVPGGVGDPTPISLLCSLVSQDAPPPSTPRPPTPLTAA